MAGFLKDRHFWYLVALTFLLGIIIYLVDIAEVGWLPPYDQWMLTYMALERLLFLGTVALAALRFGVRGGLAASFALGLIFIPHAAVMPGRPDTWLEIGTVIAIGIIFSWLIGTRKQADEKLLHAAKEWRTTFDSITDLVSIHDKDYKIIRVNKAFADAFKVKPKELIGKACYELFHGIKEPLPNCPHKKTLATRKSAVVECFAPRLGIHLEVTTSPIFDDKGDAVTSVHIARDITERKRMQEKLIVTDRLASVGKLASGVAHEVNNPLTSVIGFSELLLGRDIPKDIRRDIEIISREARRAAEVVKNLLTFARKHKLSRQPLNINDIIRKVLELRAYEYKVSNIQVNTQFAPDLPAVMADYSQLQQVAFNIIVNAEHSMIEAHNRGTLTITTERAGNIIKASFADDGHGIAKENLGHLFDPFFTTKEVGKGTGLGLSICHGIVTEHGGRIYAESELGKGATFVVELPILTNDGKKGH